jgi:hypothetical protein
MKGDRDRGIPDRYSFTSSSSKHPVFRTDAYQPKHVVTQR